MSKVVYFNIDDNLDYENSLLEQWGVTDVELAEVKDKTSGKFTEYLQDADGLVVEYEQVTKEVMARCPKLKIVAVQAIGTNNPHNVLRATITGLASLRSADDVSGLRGKELVTPRK